ncbi:MAG: nucleotidyltransferase [Lachnospiraceae bacterium]|nr:nucleotidyltransferase [Lachnospiraceae bacterium]
MKNTTLVVMAAGMGSRFGGGIKQLEKVGPSGEIIMDYSIYAAKEAGFNKVVFIIRRDLEKDFREIIGNRIEKYIEVGYVYQEMDKLPDGYTVPEGRKKPWGTGQAVLACLGTLKEPFVVINADDFYGKEAFRATHEYLVNLPEGSEHRYCMGGFVLGNTLSEHGMVTRGVCEAKDGQLVSVEECFSLRREGDVVLGENSVGEPITCDPSVPVSMNLWGFTPDFLEELNAKFADFLSKEAAANPLKAEYLLPQVVGEMVREGRASVAVLPTNDRWFGVTYKEDKPLFVESIAKLIAAGEFPEATFQ